MKSPGVQLSTYVPLETLGRVAAIMRARASGENGVSRNSVVREALHRGLALMEREAGKTEAA